MQAKINPWKLFLALFPALWLWGGEQQSLQASPAAVAPTISCAQFLAPKQNVNGKMVGQEECLMQDHGIVDPDRKFHRVQMGITGTLAGWITKEGARFNFFTSAPDFVFTHYGNHRPRFHGILRYEAAQGTSLTLLYPETGWNGKLYVLVHGASGSFRFGTMKPWDEYFDPGKPFSEYSDVNKYERMLLEKGYAVAKTRRNAARDVPGDYSAVLDNGEVWPDLQIGEIPELILDQARLVKDFLQDRLGRRPTRTYWYGHSGGAMLGTLVNYMQQFNPELNRDPDGSPTIDGLLWDDVGGGMFLPFLIRDGQDILLRTPEDKAKFVKTLEVTHHLYPNPYYEHEVWQMEIANVPEKVSPYAITNKRTRANMMQAKGLDNAYRMYEVEGVSHNGGESLESGKRGDVEILDLSRLMDGLVDLLNNWVEKGVPPPTTRSEAVGEGNSNLALPEITCPLGVYFPYPQSMGVGGKGSTSFAPFDGAGLEPVNGLMQSVDMNGNGIRDKRETVTEAWRRLGLLKAGENFSRDKYVACVQTAVATLRKENFITEKVGELYIREAKGKEPPSS